MEKMISTLCQGCDVPIMVLEAARPFDLLCIECQNGYGKDMTDIESLEAQTIIWGREDEPNEEAFRDEDTFRDIGWGTDEDYGHYGYDF